MSKNIYFFRSVSIGDPIPIIKKGQFLMENILQKKNKIDIINVASQLHAQG
ncbi:YetF domain-containing protein, partial [Pectobacterium quasiaquaticum]|uniref:YetF domain-containing protein n=1 Tax=Pectobacterium quasiaquaticum TaxID=2774015 RepID=UPI00384B435D